MTDSECFATPPRGHRQSIWSRRAALAYGIGMSGIRTGTPADLPAVEQIVEATYSPYIARMGKKPGPMLDDYAARQRNGELWVWEQDGRVAGVLVLLEEPDRLLLDNVAVAPEAQGQGVGKRLIAFAEAEAARRGYHEIALYTHVCMTENQALYRRLGWDETGRRTVSGFERVYFAKRLAAPDQVG